MTRTFTTLLCLGLCGFLVSASAQSLEERKQKILADEKQPASQEALDRKARSETQLRKEYVPIDPTLPVIADSKKAKLRTKEEIARRAIALYVTCSKASGAGQAEVDAMVKKYGADKFFSPAEAAFIKNPAPTEKDKVNFSWRSEDYWVLLWTLGYVDTLDYPKEQCDIDKAAGFLISRTTETFIKDAKLRDPGAILDQADLIYRYHWATENARFNKKDAPAGLNDEIIMERHYVLNWLTGYMDQAWDDITTDT